MVGWEVVSELVKDPITAEQILLQLLGNAITRRDLLLNTFSGPGARSGLGEVLVKHLVPAGRKRWQKS